jgi:hypothetical protein
MPASRRPATDETGRMLEFPGIIIGAKHMSSNLHLNW